MLKCRLLATIFIVGGVLLSSSERGSAAESGFSAYPLGGLGFGAGAPPPPGWYLTTAVGYYRGLFQTQNLIGGVAAVGLDVKFLAPAVNIMYAPAMEVLGGHIAGSVTAPMGCVDLAAKVVVRSTSASAETSGCGFGDMSAQLQLGWTIGDFSHSFRITGFAPTGRYETGFNPNIGLNRPAADVSWAATWLERTTGIQFNGAVGVTFNATNTATDYKTGDEFHFEWAIGKTFFDVLTLGFGGYDYRQITGDSGSGATLGPFQGRVDAVGPAGSIVTKIADHVVLFNTHIYFEFDQDRRFMGTSTSAAVTVRF